MRISPWILGYNLANMYNGFNFQKGLRTQKQAAAWKSRFERTSQSHNNRNKNFTSQSNIRTTQWIGENVNSKAATVLQQGCSSLAHPDLYQFRDYSPSGSIYLRR